MPSNDDLLFAEHAVKAGFLTDEDVRESLEVQDRMAEMGVAESLRNVLVKRGAIREGDAALVARSAGLRSGREPIPGYTLEARIGSGAMGSVYRAHQKGMKRRVAIKILRRDLTDDPRQVERLQREAKLVGQLDHPNIVRGLDAGQADGLVWFVMELAEGKTLHERIKRDGPLLPDAAIAITLAIAEALCHAHEHGVVHRDIKPGNILLTLAGEPRLTDYGLAKGESDDALTQLDATLGTPQYISPEQARNPRDADIRSDLYSLGATLYAMLAGRPPFQAESLAATLTKVLYERPMPLSEAAPGTPAEVAYVVERMMAKDRRHRYADPSELVRDLRRLQAGKLHVPAGFRGDIDEFEAARRRKRVVGGVLAVAIVGAGVAIGVLGWQQRSQRLERQQSADTELATLLLRPGAPEHWDGGTVQSMIRGLEAHVQRYRGTPAADRAFRELDRWQRQESAIDRVQQLSLVASGDTDPDWPDLIDDLLAEKTRLDAAADSSVALRRLERVLTEVRRSRIERADAQFEGVDAEVASMSLEDAARRYAGLARTIRERFYDMEPAPAAERAEALAAEFRTARTLLDAKFAQHRQRIAGRTLTDEDLQSIDTQLFNDVLAGARDKELVDLLERLPPAGTRGGLLEYQHQLERDALVQASERRWRDVKDEALGLEGQRRYVEAAALLSEFAGLALVAERGSAETERTRILARREIEIGEMLETTAHAARNFLHHVGRRDYAEAAVELDEVEAFTALWTDPDSPAAQFVSGARHLLKLIEERAWDAFRRRLRSGDPLTEGLGDGTGIRYRDVRGIVLRDERLEFTHGNGHVWQGSLRVIDRADLLRYSNLPGDDPAGALVGATLELAERPASSDPRKTLGSLTALGPLLARARTDPELGPVVDLLSGRRQELLLSAQAELDEAEERARKMHAEARRALEDGRYLIASRQFQRLLELKRIRRTDYVQRRGDEIEGELDQALSGKETSRYAAHLSGARLVKHGSGRAELVVDFENPEIHRSLTLQEGRTRIATTTRLVADQPAAGAAEDFPLSDDHFLEWLTWDGVPENHPRHAPVSLAHPFKPKKAIEVSFLYRSDAPFFLLVAIGQTKVGILSAGDVREGGRGVHIWKSDSLANPDAEFGDKYRSSYLHDHPEVLRRDGDTKHFQFRPGRTYRVRFLKDEARAFLYVDGRAVLDRKFDATPSGKRQAQVSIVSYTSGSVDDLRITGILDPDWLRSRE